MTDKSNTIWMEIQEIIKEAIIKYFKCGLKCFCAVFISVLTCHDDYGTAKAFFSCQDANPKDEIKNAITAVSGIAVSFGGLWKYMKTTDEDHRHVLLALSSMLAVFGTTSSINLMNTLTSLCMLIPINCISAFLINTLQLVTLAEVINLLSTSVLILVGTVIFDIRDSINNWLNNYIPKKILH